MTPEHVRRLLDRTGVLRHPCDFDLLMFCVRHPRTLMASEQLAAFLGYELKQISDSMDALLASGWLTRTAHPAHAARLYVLAVGGTNGDGLQELVDLASTLEGRRILRREVRRLAPGGRRDSADQSGDAASKSLRPRRPVLVPQPASRQTGA